MPLGSAFVRGKRLRVIVLLLLLILLPGLLSACADGVPAQTDLETVPAAVTAPVESQRDGSAPGSSAAAAAQAAAEEEARAAAEAAAAEQAAAEQAAVAQRAAEEQAAAEAAAAAERARAEEAAAAAAAAAAAQKASSGQTVYITNTGEKYHRNGCQYLSKSQIPMSLPDAQARGYDACSRCF